MFELEDFCQLVQSGLNEVAENNYPALKREKVGVFDAITSPQNATGSVLQNQVDPGNGKKKQVILDWLQPGLISETLTAKADICTTDGTEEPYQRELFNVTDFRSTPVMEFTFAELRKLCKSTAEVRTEVIASKMSALLKGINRDIITELNTSVGGFVGGVAAGKNVQLLNAGPPINANPLGANVILEDFAVAGLSGKPIVAGHGKLQTYARLSNYGCCNIYGTDISRLDGELDWFWDIDVAAITANADDFFAWEPGAIQLITYNEYRGDFEVIGNDYALTTLVDPVSGVTFDMKMYFDKCDEKYKLAIWLNFGVFTLPSLYKVGDARAGVNHLYKYRATQA